MTVWATGSYSDHSHHHIRKGYRTMATYIGFAQKVTGYECWKCGKCDKHWDNEHMANFCCHTHAICEGCGAKVDASEHRISCKLCRDKAEVEAWENMEIVEWDGETPLCDWGTNRYFFDEESVEEYVAESDYPMLVVCEPNKGRHFELEEWLCDELAEDAEPCEPVEVVHAVEVINRWLTSTTFSWLPGNKRVVFGSDGTPSDDSSLGRVAEKMVERANEILDEREKTNNE